MRDKGTDDDWHKGTEGQRDRAEGFFCFVPLCLCNFVHCAVRHTDTRSQRVKARIFLAYSRERPMTSERKGILILATMDTKGPEALYLRHKIHECGQKPLLMDFSTKGKRQKREADIPASEVAKAGNATLRQLAVCRDRDLNMEVMVSGAVRIVHRLLREGKIHGVLGIGGYSGFLMASEVMRSLPFGFPKILVSSAVAVPGLSNRLIQTSDILLFNSVVEIAGLTGLLKNVLDRGVLAMVGMVQGAVTEPSADRSKAIAMTMLSPCEGCARAVRAAIEKQAYPVVGFHATGIGDRAMEAMISEGLVQRRD